MKRRFATLDVFTNRRLAGNPLAVVLQSENLDVAAMQAIAGEFNLSETVFVLPPADAAHRARYRIFTPKSEMPFAGHPTVGTAVLLARLDGGEGPRDMVLEARIGPVSCRVAPAEGHASFALPAMPKEVEGPSDARVLAGSMGLDASDVGFAGFRPSSWLAGVPYTFVPLKSREAVARARPDAAKIAALGGVPLFIFSNESAEPGHHFHARMFAPSLGVLEDPATGSAAAAFTGVLARFGALKDGAHEFVIEQGYKMGRPSLIHLGLTLAGGKLAEGSVGGGAIVVCEGTIEA